ncbi:MAG: 16S rRNA (adenine(1518)-N(6)/adenine(1519)-N(6))-dimethyltransferase RsmA [Gammaproteobacteria bacterium]
MSTRPRKRFGQNFLEDDAVISRIIDVIDPREGETLVEIGPGRGAITLPLLESGCELHSIELDRDLAHEWRQRSLDRFTLHEHDALRFDFSTVSTAPLRLVGNLPYNISTPLLFHFMQYRHCFTDLHVMLQKEVAERICAAPGSKAYGRLSVMLSVNFMSEVLFDVPPDAFYPEPKVTSSIIRLVPTEPEYSLDNPKVFAEVVKKAFSMRRKTLRKSLQTLCSDADFSACDIDSSLRPEVLSPAQFAHLANYLAARPEPGA